MIARVALPLTLLLSVAAAALLANGVALLPEQHWTLGAGLACVAAALLLLPRRLLRREPPSAPPDRSAVQLALRLAGVGERTLLVDSGAGMRVIRIQEAPRGRLQFVGALAGGALILARQR